MAESKTKFEGGSTRTEQQERYDLMPPAALRALARRLGVGAKKHGDRNWESGGPEFRAATLSHLLAHITDYMEHGGQENTDAIICNAAFLCHFEECIPFRPSAAASSK